MRAFWLHPDILSLFRGEWNEGRWSEMKLGIWVLLSVLCGWAAYYQLPK